MSKQRSRLLGCVCAAAVLWGGALGCGETDPQPAPPPPPPVRFSIAVLADPHVTRPGEKEQALGKAVDWINENASTRAIEIVLLLGDIAWGNGLELAKGHLDRLTPAYVPVIGDNEIHGGSEAAFDATFAPQYDRLAGTLSEWQRAATPVDNPESGAQSWFTNVAFVHRGVRFVGLDWSTRTATGTIDSELGYLHDFEGGTWRWLQEQAPKFASAAKRGVILFGHIPMHPGPFDDAQMSKLEALLDPYYLQLYANLAGHLHLNYELEVGRALYDVFVTDPPWGEEATIRMVSAEGNGTAWSYEQELVVVP